MLKLADLGPGFKASRSSGDNSNLRCKGYSPDESDLTEIGSADSPDLTRPDGTFISSSVSIYKSAAEGATSWTRVVRPGILRCLTKVVESASDASTKLRVTGSRRLTLTKLAPRQAGYRLSVLVATGGKQIPATFDFVLLGKGDANAAVIIGTVAKAIPAADERALAGILARRLR